MKKLRWPMDTTVCCGACAPAASMQVSIQREGVLCTPSPVAKTIQQNRPEAPEQKFVNLKFRTLCYLNASCMEAATNANLTARGNLAPPRLHARIQDTKQTSGLAAPGCGER